MHDLHTLQLTDHQVFHKHVQTEPLVEGYAIVDNWRHNLPSEGESPLCQFMTEANLVDILQQTWAKRPVNSLGSIHDLLGSKLLCVRYGCVPQRHLCLCVLVVDQASPPSGRDSRAGPLAPRPIPAYDSGTEGRPRSADAADLRRLSSATGWPTRWP